MKNIIIDREQKTITVNGLHLVSRDENFTDIIVLDINDNVVWISIPQNMSTSAIHNTNLPLEKFKTTDFIFKTTNTYSF